VEIIQSRLLPDNGRQIVTGGGDIEENDEFSRSSLVVLVHCA
jgi:hypothetical protein